MSSQSVDDTHLYALPLNVPSIIPPIALSLRVIFTVEKVAKSKILKVINIES